MTGHAPQPGDPLPEPIFPPSAADEVADELRFHHDMYVRDLIARGHAPVDAERIARDQLQGFDHVGNECRQLAEQREDTVRRHRTIANLVSDVRFALRLLRHRPLFAVMAILPLALGIGAATTMYSVADSVLIRPLPFPHPDRLVAIWATESQWKNSAVSIPWQSVVIGQGEFDGLRDRAHTLSQVAAWTTYDVNIVRGTEATPITGVVTTASLFPLLGIRPVLGRVFTPNETMVDGPQVAILGWEAWQKEFGGDSAIVGRSIVVGDTSHYTIIGVLPPGVRLDRTTSVPGIWIPAFTDSSDLPQFHNRSYRGLGRLAPGVTVAQANAETAKILSDLKREWKGSVGGTSGRAEIWQDDQTASSRSSLLILGGAVLLLLLIACVNVATLMVGDAMRRRPEIFARRALGATPMRLARQLITESVVISGAGSALGALAAWVGVRVLVHAAPQKIPGITDAHVDLRVLAVTAACALVIGISFGLFPTLALLRWGSEGTLRRGMGQTARGAVALQRGLVAAEVALSLAMLVGCTLLGKSLIRLASVNPGFVANGLYTVTTEERDAFWRDNARMSRFYSAAIAAVRAIPGVTKVSGSSSPPFEGGMSSSPIEVEGTIYADSIGAPDAQQREVMGDYFHTIGVPLVAGRDFNDGDRTGSELVAIVSQSAVARDWGGRPAIGTHVKWQGKMWTVIGVVADVHGNSLATHVDPTIYVPATQSPGHSIEVTFRASGNASALTSLVKTRLAPLDPAVTVKSVDAVRTLIQHSYAEERYRTLLGSLFGVLAAVLAGVGVFGVISRTVAQRLREAGIRVALGAQERAVIELMLHDTLRGAAVGLVIGLGLAIGLARALAPYLYGVGAADPLAYLLAFGLLCITLCVATVPPARRAARVDPVTVLRSE